jgi:hypothetical protein
MFLNHVIYTNASNLFVSIRFFFMLLAGDGKFAFASYLLVLIVRITYLHAFACYLYSFSSL